jgi:predicted nucleic acid-binding protein
MIQLDSNILGRLTDSTDPQYSTARNAVHRLLSQNQRLVIVSQNCYEFWSFATRAKGAPPIGQNGLGLSVPRASQWIAFFRRRFILLQDPPGLLDQWHQLVAIHAIRGLKAHDARLAAAMILNGVPRILTFNAGDFKAFPITIVDPVSV